MQYAGHVSFELFNRPRSPKSLCGSVVEQSEGLRFDSSQGLRIFLCPTLVTRQGNIFLKTCLVCLLTLLWTHTKVRVLSYAMGQCSNHKRFSFLRSASWHAHTYLSMVNIYKHCVLQNLPIRAVVLKRLLSSVEFIFYYFNKLSHARIMIGSHL